jgi:hypothetical protein
MLARMMVVAGLLAGCGTRITYTEVASPPRPMSPKSADEVQVFSTAPPDRPYVEVGLIEAQQASEYSLDNESSVIAKLRAAAAERGCDAIMLTGQADSIVGSSSVSRGSGSGSVGTLEGYSATCLVWQSEDATVEAVDVQAAEAAPEAAGPATPPRCVPGESRACVGPGGCSGGQVCASDGASFELCDCGDGGEPEDAGGSEASASEGT